MELNRELLATVAMANPALAGAVLRLVNELREGELPQAPVLREFGEHIRDLGQFLADTAWIQESLATRGVRAIVEVPSDEFQPDG